MNSMQKKEYPKIGMSKRVASGGFFSFLIIAVISLKNLLLIPLFLRLWGPELYGEWLIIFSFVAYLSLIDLGTNTFITNKLTQCYAKGNLREYTEIFHSALRFYLIIGIVGLIILSSSVFLFHLPDFLNLKITHRAIINLTILILGMNALFGVLGGLVLGLYASVGEYYRQAAFLSAREGILVFAVAFGLILKGSFIAIALSYLIIFLTIILFAYKDIRKRHPEIIFGTSLADWSLTKKFIFSGLVFLMIPLANAIAIQGSILFVGAYLSAGAVAIFMTHKTLSNFVVRIEDVIKQSINPEITAAEMRMDYRRLQLIYGFFLKFSILFSFSLAILLFFIGRDVIELWTGGRIIFNSALWTILMINLPISLFLLFNSTFHVATNKYKNYSISKLFSAVSGLVLAFIFTIYFGWGIAGVALAFIASEAIIVGTAIIGKTSQIIGANIKMYWIKGVIKIFPLAVFNLVSCWIIYGFMENLFIRIIFLTGVVFVAGVIFFYKFLFNKEEKIIIGSLLKKFPLGVYLNQFFS